MTTSKLFTNAAEKTYGVSKLVGTVRQFKIYQCLMTAFHEMTHVPWVARDKPAELLLIDGSNLRPSNRINSVAGQPRNHSAVRFGSVHTIITWYPKLLPPQFFFDAQTHFATRGFEFLIEEKPNKWFTQQQYGQPQPTNSRQHRTSNTRIIGFDSGSKDDSYSAYNVVRTPLKKWHNSP